MKNISSKLRLKIYRYAVVISLLGFLLSFLLFYLKVKGFPSIVFMVIFSIIFFATVSLANYEIRKQIKEEPNALLNKIKRTKGRIPFLLTLWAIMLACISAGVYFTISDSFNAFIYPLAFFFMFSLACAVILFRYHIFRVETDDEEITFTGREKIQDVKLARWVKIFENLVLILILAFVYIQIWTPINHAVIDWEFFGIRPSIINLLLGLIYPAFLVFICWRSAKETGYLAKLTWRLVFLQVSLFISLGAGLYMGSQTGILPLSFSPQQIYMSNNQTTVPEKLTYEDKTYYQLPFIEYGRKYQVTGGENLDQKLLPRVGMTSFSSASLPGGKIRKGVWFAKTDDSSLYNGYSWLYSAKKVKSLSDAIIYEGASQVVRIKSNVDTTTTTTFGTETSREMLNQIIEISIMVKSHKFPKDYNNDVAFHLETAGGKYDILLYLHHIAKNEYALTYDTPSGERYGWGISSDFADLLNVEVPVKK
ncbi:MAG: hypothetical protein LBI13_07185 [Streptococcaceae bacterium]|jgi:hypothetical protein|nr:hypothetical protein [Streptococcaceae bacterium]